MPAARMCSPRPTWPTACPCAPARASQRPVVVGFGPCGIFCALLLAQMGFKPIVLERGKTVRQRTKDTWGLWRKSVLDPESNVQFGEGGAGTFSDGKLYSQIKDPRFLGRKVMEEFVKAGAPPEILYVAHPHIGTFKLVKVVENIREQIIALGGEIRFEQRVTDVHIENGQLRGLTVLDQRTGTSSELRADHVVMALGHSSRDSFEMLHARGVHIEAKPFSIGFRVEHPQGLIDRARWGRHAGHPLLGAADYKLVHHASNGRSVYSFCMCPGGTVVAATSEPGRVVTNGMSQYSRNERNANAGIVVGIDPRDYPGWEDGRTGSPLAGIALQRALESNAFVLGGGDYRAPGQLVGDFVAGKPSTALGSVEPSYKPGVTPGDLHAALPAYAIEAMREAFPAFGRKIKGFDLHDAVLTGVETRTSSPIRITRGEDFQSLNVRGLYPGGRRCELRGRHPVGGRGRHQGRRGGGARNRRRFLTGRSSRRRSPARRASRHCGRDVDEGGMRGHHRASPPMPDQAADSLERLGPLRNGRSRAPFRAFKEVSWLRATRCSRARSRSSTTR